MSQIARHTFAYTAHAFTATGLLAAFASLIAIDQGHYLTAFIYNAVAIAIDSVDGLIARKANVKKYGQLIDGALMDNIIDFLTYTIIPVFFLYKTTLIPTSPILFTLTICSILLASIFAFSNNNAKTPDHFFLGFPSYWNILMFYLFIWNLTPTANLIIIWICALLSFIPIKFIYPSRIDYLKPPQLKAPFTVLTLLWGIATILLFITFPNIPPLIHTYSILYIAIYTLISLYNTYTK